MTENGGSTRRVVDRYRLERRIGRGGAGAVWRAHDERLDRPVAIKQIPIAHDTEASSRNRALREARAAARLHSPNVVQVYDVVEEGGNAYLIMELVDAPNLNTLVRRDGPLEPEAVAAIGLQILDALEAAHRVGIVHRDVKPSNVLMNDEMPRLTDFGIARLGDDPALTSTGVVMGTPAYIAPEYARGEAVGPAVDLYGLGATLYYAVEGQPPFSAGGSLSTVMAVVSEPPRPMERAGPLTELLTELLAKDPAERPRADEIRHRLHGVADRTQPRLLLPRIMPIVADNGRSASRERTLASVPPIAADAGVDTSEMQRPDVPDPPAPSDMPVRRAARRPAMFAVSVVFLIAAAIGFNELFRSWSAPTAEVSAPTEVASAPAVAPTAVPTEASEAPTTGDGMLPVTHATIPGDWVEFAPGGESYRVQHPPGWEIHDRGGDVTEIRDPDSGTYLRVRVIDGSLDPIAAWKEQAASWGPTRDGYEHLGIEPTTYQGNEAALWEYRYNDGGVRLHAYNLAVNAGERAFTLNLQSHDPNWEDEALVLWPLFLSSFELTAP
jgi:serine/threonine protein kinase